MTTIPPSTGAHRRRLIATATAVACTIAGGALTTTTATAGTYSVVQCGDVTPPAAGVQQRNGVFAWRDGSAGFAWRGGPDSHGQTIHRNCQELQSPGRAIADMSGGYGMQAGTARYSTTPVGRVPAWRWSAPTDVSIRRFQARMRSYTRPHNHNGPGAGIVWVLSEGHGESNPHGRPIGLGWEGGGPSLSVPLVGGSRFIDFDLGCHLYTCGPFNGYWSLYNVEGFQASLADEHSPQVSSVSGELASRTYWRGTMNVSASITDRGSGVRRLVVQRRTGSAWSTLHTQDVADSTGECRTVNAASMNGEPVYEFAAPCPPAVTGATGIDTDQLPEGTAVYRVLVEDAAENTATVLGEDTRTVDRTAPTVSWAGTPSTCPHGERVAVRPAVSDAVSGVSEVDVTVRDRDGVALPVADDGSITCPDPSRGPLTISATATDKAGNATTSTRGSTVLVTAKPAPPEDGTNPFGGAREVPPPSVPTFPAPPALPAPTAPVTLIPKTEGASKLLQCSRQRVVLTEVYPSRGRDVLRGVADPSHVGKKVTITYVGTGRVVATPTVQADGSFAQVVRSPKGKQARGNRGRYRASIGTDPRDRSADLKRMRRMYTAEAYRAASGQVYISGTVTRPFKSGATVRIMSRKTCSSWSTVRSVRVSRSGRWGALLPLAGTGNAVVLRAQTEVRRPKSKRTSRTYTLPTAIQLVG